MKKYSKSLFVTVLAVLVLGVFVSSTLSSCHKKVEKKKVGVVFPLTGDLAFVGEFMKNSLLLDTTDVTYIIEDCQSKPSQATMAANKLINQDKVSYVVSTLSFLSEAINPVCESKNIPHFILSFSPTLVDKSNIIQPFVSTRLEAEKFVDYISSNGYQKVAFLRHQEPDATYGFENIIEPKLKEMGVEIMDFAFNNATIKDFKPEILKIKQAEPELLVIQSLAYNIPNIVSAIKTYDLTIPILGDVNFLDIQDAQTMELVAGIPFVGIQSVLTPNYSQFKQRYIEKYKIAPFALGSFAYDLGLYLRQIPVHASMDEIMTLLNGMKDPSLVNDNEIRFDKSGQENVVCKILTFKDNDVVEY